LALVEVTGVAGVTVNTTVGVIGLTVNVVGFDDTLW
jgi:hypothetical protein